MFNSIIKEEIILFLKTKQHLSKRAYDWYKSILKSLDECFVNNDVQTINSCSVNLWLASLVGMKSTKYAKIERVRTFFSFLKKRGICVYIPMLPKKTDEYKPYIFSDEEIKDFLDEADNLRIVYKSPLYPNIQIQYPIILRILIFTGLRIGETLNLKVKDVNLEEGFFHLKKTKYDKERYVPFDFSMKQIITLYINYMNLADKKEAFLFYGKSHDIAVDSRTMSHFFNKSLVKQKIMAKLGEIKGRGICIHLFRHYFVCSTIIKLKDGSSKISEICLYFMTFLGHSTFKATERYLKFDYKSIAESADLFDKFVKGKLSNEEE